MAELVAVIAAGVSGGGEDRLALRGGLLEQQVLGLLDAGLAELHGLLAQAPAGVTRPGPCRR